MDEANDYSIVCWSFYVATMSDTYTHTFYMFCNQKWLPEAG